MNLMDRNLARKIALVLLLKFALLLVLWWGFVREQRVTVDADKVAEQLLQGLPMLTQGVRP
jgi:sensor domain CHASE-containing protein